MCPENVHTGDLEVDEDSDLSLLHAITRVTGLLEIEGVESADLSFLGCLETAEENLYIRDSDELETLDGLGRLADGHGLIVDGNDKLRSLEGLDSLTHVGNSITVKSNRSLTTLGLDQLETVADVLLIGGCELYEPRFGNEALTDITGLSGLKSIRSFGIAGNNNLVTLDGLRVLAENNVSIESFWVMHNRALPREHVEEIVELLQPDEAFFCGNEGDERPWENPDPDTFDPEFCRCGVGGE